MRSRVAPDLYGSRYGRRLPYPPRRTGRVLIVLPRWMFTAVAVLALAGLVGALLLYLVPLG